MENEGHSPTMSKKNEAAGADSLGRLLEELEPRLKKLLARFRIPASNAEAMLEDCLMVLVYRQDQIADPGRWLERTLRYRCIRHWRHHQQQLCRTLDAELRRWLADEAVSHSEIHTRQRLLGDEIGRLPDPCQPVLRSRLGLDEQRAAERPQSATRTQRDPYDRCLMRLMRQLLDGEEHALEGLRPPAGFGPA